MTGAESPSGFDGVVVDVEGTTTPVSFVYDVLFPYARARLPDYLAAHSRDVGDAIELLRAELRADLERGEALIEPAAAANASEWATYLEWLMDRDRKSPGLKLIQGRIWDLGFGSGALRGEVYADVAPAFARWREAGLTVSIYSSGSVLAQRQLFTHGTAGDLSPLIGHYFDTGVGAKREPESYRRIAAALGTAPSRLLFISDVVAELDAAGVVGMQTRLCVRDALPAQTGGHVVIASFDTIAA